MKTKVSKTLVIGAAGFVGRALTQKLISVGQQPSLVVRSKRFTMPGAKIFHGDIGDRVFCRRVLSGVDTVYYVAGYKRNIDFHVRQPFDFFAGNVEPFTTFLKVLEASKVKTLVYLSSTIVEYVQLDASKPDGYVLGKFANELAARSFAQQYPEVKVKIIRSAAIYGPGDNFNPATANFIPAMIRKVAQSRGEVEVWGQGTRKLQFAYIDDVVSNLLAAPKSKKNFFVVGNPQAVSVTKVVQHIVKFLGQPKQLKHDLSKPDKPTKLTVFSNAIKPRVSLSEGLARTLEYYRKHHA